MKWIIGIKTNPNINPDPSYRQQDSINIAH